MADCGTSSGYVAGCRCDLCRRAHNTKQTLWRQTGTAAKPFRHRALPTQHPWIDQAACAGHDPNHWYVAEQTTYTYARAICATCPVRSDCLDWALRAGEVQGFWGGKSPKERREIRCGRRAS